MAAQGHEEWSPPAAPNARFAFNKQTMEVEILKEALELAQAKKPSLLSHSPLPGDTW